MSRSCASDEGRTNHMVFKISPSVVIFLVMVWIWFHNQNKVNK